MSSELERAEASNCYRRDTCTLDPACPFSDGCRRVDLAPLGYAGWRAAVEHVLRPAAATCSPEDPITAAEHGPPKITHHVRLIDEHGEQLAEWWEL